MNFTDYEQSDRLDGTSGDCAAPRWEHRNGGGLNSLGRAGVRNQTDQRRHGSDSRTTTAGSGDYWSAKGGGKQRRNANAYVNSEQPARRRGLRNSTCPGQASGFQGDQYGRRQEMLQLKLRVMEAGGREREILAEVGCHTTLGHLEANYFDAEKAEGMDMRWIYMGQQLHPQTTWAMARVSAGAVIQCYMRPALSREAAEEEVEDRASKPVRRGVGSAGGRSASAEDIPPFDGVLEEVVLLSKECWKEVSSRKSCRFGAGLACMWACYLARPSVFGDVGLAVLAISSLVWPLASFAAEAMTHLAT